MILITGANGHLGRRLIDALVDEQPIRALVRSERAAASIETPGVEVRIGDYLDLEAMKSAASGCTHIVHLVGIIKESESSSFTSAHEGTTAVIIEAARAAGINRVIYLSILGATPNSANACLASKARAEGMLLESSVPALILRIPMVLGEGDHASRALFFRARSRFSVQLRASSLEQPIYAGDVVRGVLAGIRAEPVAETFALDLAGAESLSRRALTQRAADMLGRRTRVFSVPLWVGLLVAWAMERSLANPPLSRAMLGVLDHDDRIDPGRAIQILGLTLTSLDEALRRCLVESPPG